MFETQEINALLNLVDDPDQEVYTTVSNKIINFGRGIIPNLENLWENTADEDIQNRIEYLIHKLHYNDLTSDFKEWKGSKDNDLLFGSLLVAKFQYPNLQTNQVVQDIEKIRRNIWLELNNYLTPLEQANVLKSILYNYYRLVGTEVDYKNTDQFYLHKVLETKKGSTFINSIIYQILCELLDIKAKVINIPNQMLIAFYGADYESELILGIPQEKILFFVDASDGSAHSHQEINNYFKRLGLTLTPKYLKPLSNKRIIQLLIEELSQCFNKASSQEKHQELLELADLLNY